VSNAYVQGIIDGEAVKESGKISWVHIEIH
jgi:hypothetical protein